MKKNFLLATVFSLLVLAVSASAQGSIASAATAMQAKTANFAGNWVLDVSKSKLGDRNSIESQTLAVTQTEKDITVATATKRLPPPADAPQGGGMGGGRPGGGMDGMMGGGDGTKTYTLDGKEVKSEMQGPQGSIPVVAKAQIENGKLHISTSSTFTSPMGEMTTTSKETWELAADGNTLTVSTERTTPRGTNSTTKVFVKKS